jgi:hypothetical protein
MGIDHDIYPFAVVFTFANVRLMYHAAAIPAINPWLSRVESMRPREALIQAAVESATGWSKSTL